MIEQLSQQGILPLFFHKDANVSIEIVKALYAAGIRLIEFTNRGPEAAENFRTIIAQRDKSMQDLLVGAGTIKTADDARIFMNAGADFIISPGLNEEVGHLLRGALPWMPGCMTPSEIMRAEMTGARIIKLFPGSLLGPSFVDAIKELFPELSFIPTGGVKMEAANLEAWFRSGVIAVGAGSTLIDKKHVAEKRFALITEATRHAVQMVAEARSNVL